MEATFPNNSRVRLKRKLGTLPAGSEGVVTNTVFIATDEYCDVDFDDVPGDSTILVPVGMLGPA